MNRKQPPPRSAGFVAGPPDFSVGALDKATDVKGTIGAAWLQPDGRIRIKLNPFVVLDTFKQDLVITLFPADRTRGPAPYAEEADPGPARPGVEPPY